MANRYEAIFIVNAEIGEEKVTPIVERVKALIESSATLEKFDDWGVKRLAYPINYVNDGHYTYTVFEARQDFPKELERVLSITENVIRYLVIRL
ncbi:MAG: 30S ribosomal protein S6 [Oscillospiraceae bacterium]|nr:30S ribosomal protein S6 [Oscillospiraceae bacterium]